MSEIEDILEVRFDGGGINPSKVRASEIAKLIVDFEKAIIATLAVNYPEISTEAVLVTFEKIDNKSLDLFFKPASHIAKPAIVATYLLIATCLSENNFSQLPSNTISALKDITKFSKRHQCKGYFNLNEKNIATFTPETEIAIEKDTFVKGETSIYGKVIDVGGENPNVHFKINNDYTIIFNVSEEEAKILAPKLFEEVGLKGVAKWDVNTYEVKDFKISGFIDFNPTPLKNTFTELRNVLGPYWDNIDDIKAYLT